MPASPGDCSHPGADVAALPWMLPAKLWGGPGADVRLLVAHCCEQVSPRADVGAGGWAPSSPVQVYVAPSAQMCMPVTLAGVHM